MSNASPYLFEAKIIQELGVLRFFAYVEKYYVIENYSRFVCFLD